MSARCVVCSKEAPARLGAGWKAMPEGVMCGDCKRSRYVLRAVEFPVLGPEEGTWTDLRELLSRCWGDSTRLANWVTAELSRRDVVRTADMKKMPAMASAYLYPQARKLVPEMSTGSVVSLLQAVERKYRAKRFGVVWTGAASLPSYRYPFPCPFHNASWRASFSEQNRPQVRLRLNGQPTTLLLRGGPEFARQLGAFKQLVEGKAVQGEASIYRRAFHGESGQGMQGREPGGGSSRIQYRVMVKLVGWFPRKAPSQETNVLLVRTDPNAFLVAEWAGHDPMVFNGDHVRERQESHRVYRQRLSEDLKYEKRWPKPVRRSMMDRLRKRCAKNDARNDGWIAELVGQITALATRQKCGAIVYDDQVTSYCDFPWLRLKDRLALGCENRGIGLVYDQSRSLADWATHECEEDKAWSQLDITQAKAWQTALRRLLAGRSRGALESHRAVSLAPAT